MRNTFIGDKFTLAALPGQHEVQFVSSGALYVTTHHYYRSAAAVTLSTFTQPNATMSQQSLKTAIRSSIQLTS